MFKRSFFSPLILLRALLFGTVLHAAPAVAVDYSFNVGVLPASAPYTQTVFHQPASFNDIFNFDLSSSSAVSGATVSLQLSLSGFDLLHISDSSVSLYSTLNPMVELASGVNGFSVSNLAFGSYFVTVSGVADGSAGGQYLFGLTAIPVPEPGQWMLFIAGLVVVGSIVRRRTAL